MAWNYLTLHGKDKATPIIRYYDNHYIYKPRVVLYRLNNMYRQGIRNYIDQNYGKVKNVYNETITMFFIHMVHTAIELVRLRTNSFTQQ